MRGLKDQLEKLGLKSSIPEKKKEQKGPHSRKRRPNHQENPRKQFSNRPPHFKRPHNSDQRNQEQSLSQILSVKGKTICDSCSGSFPDVEYYEHRNRLVSVKWLCVRCADQNQIHDETRKTCQSDLAKRGQFRREYGPTNRKLR